MNTNSNTPVSPAPSSPAAALAHVEAMKALLAGEREYCVYEGCVVWADVLCGKHARQLGLL